MTEINQGQTWKSAESYEPYVGRWSRLVARDFVNWLSAPEQKSWVDVGCGTGALSRAILDQASPAQVTGFDRSFDYVEYAGTKTYDARARFGVSDAQRLPFSDEAFDACVSGLMLNFVPDPEKAVSQMARVVRMGGLVGAYVWDYAGEMQLMRRFWDAACEQDPAACELDEGARFKVCNPSALDDLFRIAGLTDVETRAIDVPTIFRDFSDYWEPFLGGQGPAPSYAMSLTEERRTELAEKIRGRMPIRANGSIHLIARAWAVRGKKKNL